MTRTAAVAAAEAAFDSGAFLKDLAAWVAVPTESQHPRGAPALRAYLADHIAPRLERLGASCRIVDNPMAGAGPFLIAERREGDGLPTVLTYGHGDTVLGMSLAHGGHLTHGASVNFSGKIYHAVQYGLNPETGLIDYDEVEALAVEHKPKMIIAGFSAYSQELDFARFREIADKVGAYLFVDMAHVAGLVAAGVYPDPVPHAHVVATTTHKTLRGPRGGLILACDDADLQKKLNSAVFPGGQGGPLMHVIAAKAVCFKEAMSDEFKAYQQQVVKNAAAMAEVFIERGFDVVSGGTKNHLFLVSLIKQDITGKDADAALGRAHITVNKNAVPNDPRSPFVTSGLRIGTPAITTRGFGESECRDLAGWICDILDNLDDDAVNDRVRGQVEALCARFPVYG